MTDEPPAEHDVDAGFDEEDCGLVDGFQPDDEPDGIRVSGRCPRCRARTSFTFQNGTPGAVKGLRFPWRREPAPAPETATVFCACGFPHAGRPGDSSERGCGAYWKIKLS